MSDCLITTYTGRSVNPLALREEDVCLEDIAHALALCNRFAGHTRVPLSVAQHSVYVSRLLDGTGFEMYGLFHDASEAYLGDVTKWLKREMPAYRNAELHAEYTIHRKFHTCDGHQPFMPDEVRQADRLMVRFEAWKLMPRRIDAPSWDYAYSEPPTPEEIRRVGPWRPWGWRTAEELFLARYRLLSSK